MGYQLILLHTTSTITTYRRPVSKNTTWNDLTETGSFLRTQSVSINNDFKNMTHIAIGLAFRPPKLNQTLWRGEEDFIKNWFIFRTFLPSFCATSSPYFAYHFYITYDHDDKFLSLKNHSNLFRRKFEKGLFECRRMRRDSSYDALIWSLSYRGKPAWAQNDAMMVAYLERRSSFYYRVNDDTKFTTEYWTEAFVKALSTMNPKNVGVTGPRHRGGNIGILTYDFVHTRHIDIFGYYYPHIFGAYYNDAWITEVYNEERVQKLNTTHVLHKAHRSRYHPEYQKKKLVPRVVNETKKALHNYIEALSKYKKLALKDEDMSNNVVVYCVKNASLDILAGLVRNVHLVKLYLPAWKVRIYIQQEERNQSSCDHDVGDLDQESMTALYFTHLKSMGTQIFETLSYDGVHLNRMCLEHIFNDSSVENFSLKSPHHRLTPSESDALNAWSNTSDKPLLCLKNICCNPKNSDLCCEDKSKTVLTCKCIISVSKSRISSSLKNVIKERSSKDHDLKVSLTQKEKVNYANSLYLSDIETMFDKYEQPPNWKHIIKPHKTKRRSINMNS